MIDNMNINHISVSRDSTWKQCQYQYKFRYHEKIPRPGEEPFYFVFGKLVHKILELYVEGKGEVSSEECTRMVLEGEAELEPNKFAPPLNEWAKGYKPRLPRCVANGVKLADKMGFGNDILEHKFHYDLDGEGRHVMGFIDWLKDHGDGKYTVIDYKTTKKGPFRETAQTVTKNLQLRTYARVVQKEFGAKPEDIRCALYYLEDASLIAAKFNEESLEFAEKQLLEAYKQIEQTTAEKAWPNVGRHCSRCDYKTLCMHYNV